MDLKRVLITGKNSYVGTNVEKWLMREPDKYYVESISVRDDSWKYFDFSKFDVVFHVAGIAHIKEIKKNRDLYYKVNRDLAIEVANKAKDSDVKHFVFMSTMSVYGIDEGRISIDSIAIPNTFYGKSKLEAENLIITLNNDKFKVAVLRPPLIYGKDSPGNYSKLSYLSKSIRIFPDIDNIRSMIYIENLCEYIKIVINNSDSKFHFPQNFEYVCTTSIVKNISIINGNKVIFTKMFNIFLKNFKFRIIRKIFGDLIYDKKMSNFDIEYNLFNFKDSIINTELK